MYVVLDHIMESKITLASFIKLNLVLWMALYLLAYVLFVESYFKIIALSLNPKFICCQQTHRIYAIKRNVITYSNHVGVSNPTQTTWCNFWCATVYAGT